MKSTDPSSASEAPDPWSPEELAKYWATVPKPPYRKYNLTQAERDQLAKSIRISSKARRIAKETGRPVFEVEYKGEIYQLLQRLPNR
jgi:hypothetical protein